MEKKELNQASPKVSSFCLKTPHKISAEVWILVPLPCEFKSLPTQIGNNQNSGLRVQSSV